MKNRTVVILFGILLSALAALGANAQPCGNMGGPGAGMHSKGMMMEGMGPGGMGMMMDMDHHLWKHIPELGLDDKQKSSIEAVRTRTVKDMIKRKAELQVVHIELKDLLDKDPVDMKAVESAARKCEAIRTEMLLAHIKAGEEAKALLTAEQRKKLKEAMVSCQGAGGCMMHSNKGHDGKAGYPEHECKH